MEKMHENVRFIMDALHLSLHPQAVKMIENESEIPASAIRASEKYGHLAYCQAQAMAKRNGRTIYMGIKDHWCWANLVGFGMVDCDPGTPSFDEVSMFMGMKSLEKSKEFFAKFPRLPKGKYIGNVVGPAESADFIPDVVLISCDNNFQMRTLLWAIKNQTGDILRAELDPIDSCIYTIVEPMLTGEYRVAIPDPGEQERALTGANEIILGVPYARLQELADGLYEITKMHASHRDMESFMKYDYERPPFYNRLYEMWGLETGRDWDFGETGKKEE